MATPRRYSQLVTIATRFHARTLGLLGAIVVAVSAYLAAPTTAAAMPTTYALSGVTASFGSSGTDTITGTFTFDPSNPANDSVDFEVSGPILPGDYYLQSFIDSRAINATTGVGCSVSGTDSCMSIIFQLSFSPFLNLNSVMLPFTMSTVGAVNIASAVSGAATPAPEPASLVLLGGAVGLFFLTRRANRRRSPSQSQETV
jgi:hypothetical protein